MPVNEPLIVTGYPDEVDCAGETRLQLPRRPDMCEVGCFTVELHQGIKLHLGTRDLGHLTKAA